MLQVMSPEETTFPYGGSLELEDLESGERRLVDAGTLQRDYRAAVAGFLERCRTLAHRDGVDYSLMSTGSPPERVLRDYLIRRGARDQSGHSSLKELR